MKFYATIDTSEGRKRFELMAGSLEHLATVLKLFRKYLMVKAKGKFKAEGPGWPALAPSTIERLQSLGVGRTTQAGGIRQTARTKAIVKALKKDETRNAELLARLKAVTRSGGGGNLGQLIRASSLRKQHKAELLNVAKEIFRIQALAEKGKAPRKQRKAITKHKLLGRLASTLRAMLKKNNLIIYSVVDWAGEHNEGGNQVPERTFLELDEQDLDVLVALLLDNVVDPKR